MVENAFSQCQSFDTCSEFHNAANLIAGVAFSFDDKTPKEKKSVACRDKTNRCHWMKRIRAIADKRASPVIMMPR